MTTIVLPGLPGVPSAPVVPVVPVLPVAPVAPVAPEGPAGPATGVGTATGTTVVEGGVTTVRSHALIANAAKMAIGNTDTIFMIVP